MHRIEINSLDDPRVAVYRNLKDRELALDGQRFIAEGQFILERMLAGGWQPESVLVARSRCAEIVGLLEKHRGKESGPEGAGVKEDAEEIPGALPGAGAVYVTEDRNIDAIIGYKFHLGVLACGRRKPSPTLAEVLGPADGGRDVAARGCTLVICPEIINHDNVGALVRIAAGLGADAMILGERSCDPFWRRSIRVSMGAVFQLPLIRSQDIRADLRRLRAEWGVELAATVLDAQAQPLAEARRPGMAGRVDRLGLLVGCEAQGLPASFVRWCDRKLTIPMAHGVDSLNVAVATAIFLHHLRRS